MRSVFVLIYNLLAVLPLGHSNICIQCSSTSENNCLGQEVQCSPGDICLSIYERTLGNSAFTHNYYRTCGTSKQCGQFYSYIDGEITYNLAYSCCTSDSCLPPEPDMLSNGWKCASCSADGSFCNTEQVVDCIGTANQCFSSNVTYSKGEKQQIYIEGCTTDNICNNLGLTDLQYATDNDAVASTTCKTSTDNRTSLTCVQCNSNITNSCTGPEITCSSSQDVCISIYETESNSSTVTHNYYRRCGTSKQCGQFFSNINGEITTNLAYSCCTSDSCLPSEPDMSPNGWKCPSCSADGLFCNTGQVVNCIGTANQCFRSNVFYSQGKVQQIHIEGCTTDNICNNLGLTDLQYSTDNGALASTTCQTSTDNRPSLNCIQCNSNINNSCTGPEITCSSSQDVCISIYETKSIGALTEINFYRDCGTSEQCGQFYSFIGGEIVNNLAYSCCQGNSCLPLQPNMSYNGLTCPSCSAEFLSCNTGQFVDCIGTANQCISSTLTYSQGGMTQFHVDGCTTENICKNVNLTQLDFYDENVASTSTICQDSTDYVTTTVRPTTKINPLYQSTVYNTEGTLHTKPNSNASTAYSNILYKKYVKEQSIIMVLLSPSVNHSNTPNVNKVQNIKWW
ncbi:Hypothetical predicted protein [Pelobates cultripes]|uniref:UPAR/Ly6 domain-containing protein n=1 Tax=Pelobates cultripes TaxID=61616 RepID=A0AAD1WQC3_PELCU|nr:Hypothetical predicted protein [Pelobates cultripes]